MKKLFIVTLAVLFAAGAAYAVDYDYSGMINTRGTYISNSSGEEEDAGNYMDYDMEFDSTLVIKPSDKSSIHLNWEIHDEGFGSTPTDSQSKTGDDNIAFKRAFGAYTFDTGTSVDFGLMTGGTWATAFGDNANGFYRVKLTQPTDFGVVVGLVEKNAENGSDYGNTAKYSVLDPTGEAPWDAEADDGDTYALALVTKFGNIGVKPLLKYATQGQLEADEGTDLTVVAFDLGVDGDFGVFKFESEFIYANFTYDTEDGGFTGLGDDEDYNQMGAYLNAWTTLDAFEVGGMLAWGSYDKDGGTAGRGAGFGFGEDFGPGFWVMDWEHFGSNGRYEYYAATLVSVYGSYAVSDALSLYGALEYMMSNEEETYYEGATGTIFNASLTYKIADNVTYSIVGAYGQFTFDDWTDAAGNDYDKVDSDPFMRLAHKIQINF